MLGFITRRDYRLMQRANHWDAPGWVRFWARAATKAGDGWIWALFGLGILLFADVDRFAALCAGGLATALSVLSFMCLKHITGRRRPCHIEPHCWATLLPPDQFSFPSGHTMTAFAATTSLSLFYPALLAALLFFALSIAISRILLGMHFLSDVVAGAVIGSGLGYCAFLAFA